MAPVTILIITNSHNNNNNNQITIIIVTLLISTIIIMMMMMVVMIMIIIIKICGSEIFVALCLLTVGAAGALTKTCQQPPNFIIITS